MKLLIKILRIVGVQNLTTKPTFALGQGKDSILSGPAGGIVGAARTCEVEGLDHVVGFDMGGTSTDVCHYKGEYERAFETEVAGVRWVRSCLVAAPTN